MATTVLRPAEPPGGDYLTKPSPEAALRRCSLRLDPEAGTAVWVPDRRRARSRTLRYAPGQPGALAGLRRVRYRTFFAVGTAASSYGCKLVLVDETGRALASSAIRRPDLFDLVWPESMLPPGSGLTMDTETYRTTYRLNRAHRGAARLWPLTSNFLSFLVCVLVVIAIGVAVVAALVAG